MNPEFYKGRRVLVTGHTGFKGSWLCRILTILGAEVTGYSLEPPTEPNMFEAVGADRDVSSVIGDIRDRESLKKVFDNAKPQTVFHLAAQPIVREGYRKPALTYETNIMGTVNVLECIRASDSVESFLNVTTDKVYENSGSGTAFIESDRINGADPYSNSKSCSELVTASYRGSFFAGGQVSVSTARAGNVIGGGDFAVDRIIPDCYRAAARGEAIRIRNPHSVRPYQHVMEPLYAYLMIACRQCNEPTLAGSYNVGPDSCDCIETGELARLFCENWSGASFRTDSEKNAPKEAELLRLDCSLIKSVFGWKPEWHIGEAVEKTAEWYRTYADGGDVRSVTEKQITEYLKLKTVKEK